MWFPRTHADSRMRVAGLINSPWVSQRFSIWHEVTSKIRVLKTV
jgi:hypothetical protein